MTSQTTTRRTTRPSARASRAAVAGLALASAALLVQGPTAGAAPQVSTKAVARATTVAAGAEHGGRAADPLNPSNPLAGRPWGVYKGNQEQSWRPYLAASGTTKDMLAEIALRPKSKWFGAWIKPADIRKKVRDHIANAQAGNPRKLVQLTTFALKPWEHDACKKLPTEEQKSFYRRWVDEFAAGLGNAHVALVLQADGPFALCAPGGSTIYSRLIRYSAIKFAAQPNTSVYIDAGAADWMKDDVARALRLLIPAGVEHVRGFALNSTHYSQTEREVMFGSRVLRGLYNRGIKGKRFIVNTSSNGQGFAGYTYKGSNYDHARVCATTEDTACVTLGIPPTLDVGNARWGLSDLARFRARRYVDAFQWFGRPWLYMQADPFDAARALQLVRTWPYRPQS